jgi:hypothetical protein
MHFPFGAALAFLYPTSTHLPSRWKAHCQTQRKMDGDRFGTEFETPPTARGRSDGKGPKKQCCTTDSKILAILCVLTVGVFGFLALEIAIVAKSDDLDQTSRSTVAMREETVAMRQNVEAYIAKLRTHMPVNQDTVSLEQVVDIIDKVHSTVLYVNSLKTGIPPETIQHLVKNADTLVGNVSSVVGAVKAMFDSFGQGENVERHRTMVNNAALFFAKGAELLSTVSPGEFHATFAATHEAIQSMAKLSQNISQDRVNRIVESASDILGSVESEHIVAVVGKLVKGATDIIERFTQPLSMFRGPPGPPAAVPERSEVAPPPRVSLPVAAPVAKK